jgi:hypothetical protein
MIIAPYNDQSRQALADKKRAKNYNPRVRRDAALSCAPYILYLQKIADFIQAGEIVNPKRRGPLVSADAVITRLIRPGDRWNLHEEIRYSSMGRRKSGAHERLHCLAQRGLLSQSSRRRAAKPPYAPMVRLFRRSPRSGKRGLRVRDQPLPPTYSRPGSNAASAFRASRASRWRANVSQISAMLASMLLWSGFRPASQAPTFLCPLVIFRSFAHSARQIARNPTLELRVSFGNN